MNIKILPLVAAVSCLFGLIAGSAFADTKTSNSQYKIKFRGLTLGTMNFKAEVNGDNFKISGELASSSLADIVAKTRGSTKVEGKVASGYLQANTYNINYTTGKKNRAFSVNYDDSGKVTDASMSPVKKTLPGDWVALKDEHLLSVVDPISALTFPYDPAQKSVCSKAVSVFDGETAVDLNLSFKSHRRFKTKGFNGRVVVCNVKVAMKGGYRSNHDSIKFIQQSGGMEVWMGLNKHINAYVPVVAIIPTKIGDVRVWASKLGS